MENEAEFDEIEYVSKSQLKRESHALQDLGKKLVALPADQLSRIPLDDPLLEAISLAKRIQNKRSALKRHYQFLGKLLRARDTDPIYAALIEIEQEKPTFHPAPSPRRALARSHRRTGQRSHRGAAGGNRVGRPPKVASTVAQLQKRAHGRQAQPALAPDLQRNQASPRFLNLDQRSSFDGIRTIPRSGRAKADNPTPGWRG